MSFFRPSPGNVTRGVEGSHVAYDYGHGNGYYVYAAEAGTLTREPDVYGYGNRISINHGSGLVTRYAHLALFMAENGRVTKGQLIGHQGASGVYAQGVHLHFEVLKNGVKQNPGPYFSGSAGGGVTPIEEDDMSAAAEEKINAIYAGMFTGASVMIDGVAQKFNYGVLPVVTRNQTLIAQGNAQSAAENAALLAAIKAISVGNGFDPAAVEAAAKAGAAEALKDINFTFTASAE